MGFDPNGSDQLEAAGATVVDAIGTLADQLHRPRVALSYVPHDAPTEQVVGELAETFRRR